MQEKENEDFSLTFNKVFILPRSKNACQTPTEIFVLIQNREGVSLKMKENCSCVHRGGIIKEEGRSLYMGETIIYNAREDCLFFFYSLS